MVERRGGDQTPIPINTHTIEAAEFLRFLDGLTLDDFGMPGDIFALTCAQGLYTDYDGGREFKLNPEKATSLILDLAARHNLGGNPAMLDKFREIYCKHAKELGLSPESNVKKVANKLTAKYYTLKNP